MDKNLKKTGNKSRTVFSLESPYTASKWPDITAEEQATVLELLCNLLGPIGQHRSAWNQPSKGKRSKKRKRQIIERALSAEQRGISEPTSEKLPESPAQSELSAFLTIGFNSTTRQLEGLAQKSVPCPLPSSLPKSLTDGQSQTSRKLGAVFVPRSSQPSILNSHLPLLIATASLAYSSSPSIRLVTLPKGAEERLSAALALPRVGLVGLMEGAPHSAPLLGYVREHVADLEVPWLTEATAGKYLTLKINAVQTTAPTTQSEVANGNKLRPNGHGVKLEATEKPTDVPMIVD